MKTKLSIVIPVWNNYNFTAKCIEDLSYLPDDHEVIIVDNGSTDATRKLECTRNVRIIRNKTNLGFSRAVNIGYTMSSGEHVMFLNNDIKIKDNKESWTLPIIEASERGGLVGPTIGVLDSSFNFICEADKMPSKGHVYMSGWNLTASVSTWTKLILPEYKGPFTEEFGTYFEDTDLSMRATEIGIGMEIVPCPVHHFGKMTSKKLGTLNLYMPAKQKFITKWTGRADAILKKGEV